MACESGQGCGAGQGCGTNACSSENLCSKDERVFPPNGKKSGVCAKCKEQPTSEDFELCCTCLHTNLISKFKTAVNQNSLVTPADHVLVAFSGGAASRFDHLAFSSCICRNFLFLVGFVMQYHCVG